MVEVPPILGVVVGLFAALSAFLSSGRGWRSENSCSSAPGVLEAPPASAEAPPASAEVAPASAEVAPASAEVAPASAEVAPASAEVGLTIGREGELVPPVVVAAPASFHRGRFRRIDLRPTPSPDQIELSPLIAFDKPFVGAFRRS